VTACAAFPWVVWRLKRGPLRLRTLLCGGAVLGNLPFAVLMLLAVFAPHHMDSRPTVVVARELVRTLIIGAVFGVVGAAVFWAASIRGSQLDDREST
jgi:type III secretory pathway component EscT